MSSLKEVLDDFQQKFREDLSIVVEKYKDLPVTKRNLMKMYDASFSLFKDFKEMQPAVNLGIASQSIKAGLFDLIMEKFTDDEEIKEGKK